MAANAVGSTRCGASTTATLYDTGTILVSLCLVQNKLHASLQDPKHREKHWPMLQPNVLRRTQQQGAANILPSKRHLSTKEASETVITPMAAGQRRQVSMLAYCIAIPEPQQPGMNRRIPLVSRETLRHCTEQHSRHAVVY